MKLLGIFIICISSALIGFSKAEGLKAHYNEQIYLKKIVMLIRGEIRYNCSVLSEVFGSVSGKVRKPYSDIFSELSDELDKGSGEMFAEIWNRVVIEKLGNTKLFESDIEGLRELGECMGYLDIEMQLNHIDFYIDKLSEEIKDTGNGLKGNVKLCKALGIMGGLLLAILII